jgi:hypothetical protein
MGKDTHRRCNAGTQQRKPRVELRRCGAIEESPSRWLVHQLGTERFRAKVKALVSQKRRPALGGALWGTTGRRDMYLYICGSVGGSRVRLGAADAESR